MSPRRLALLAVLIVLAVLAGLASWTFIKTSAGEPAAPAAPAALASTAAPPAAAPAAGNGAALPPSAPAGALPAVAAGPVPAAAPAAPAFLAAESADVFRAKLARAGKVGHQVLAADRESVTMEYAFPAPVVARLGAGDAVAFAGAEQSGRPGAPVLPVKPARILLPAGRELAEVVVTPGGRVEIPGAWRLRWGQKPIPILPGAKGQPTPPDQKIYGANQPFPGQPSVTVGVQRRRGAAVLHLNLNPIEYRPASGKLAYYRTMKVSVKTKPAAAKSAARFRPDPARPLAVDNPATLGTYEAAPAGDVAPLGLCDPAQSFAFVAAAPASFLNSAENPMTAP